MSPSDASTGFASWFSKARVYGAHFVLVVSMLAWRALGAQPSISAEQGSAFFTSWPMEALAVLSILTGVTAALVMVAGSLRAWRDWQLLLLLALFAGSMWHRRGPMDALDLAYVVVALLACTRHFTRARRR